MIYEKKNTTIIFNLSILRENKGGIMQASTIKPLVELMVEPTIGMVDKVVAMLANLVTILDEKHAFNDEHGILV